MRYGTLRLLFGFAVGGVTGGICAVVMKRLLDYPDIICLAAGLVVCLVAVPLVYHVT